MIPKKALNKIRSVYIHHNAYYIFGFTFLDKDGRTLWNIGDFESAGGIETIEIAENERIVGVVAKFGAMVEDSIYTDF